MHYNFAENKIDESVNKLIRFTLIA